MLKLFPEGIKRFLHIETRTDCLAEQTKGIMHNVHLFIIVLYIKCKGNSHIEPNLPKRLFLMY